MAKAPVAIAAMLAALTLTACGDDDGGSVEPTTAASDQQAAAAKPAAEDEQDAAARPVNRERPTGLTVTTGESQFGEILFDDSNQAIYLFDLEDSETSECYDECAVAWPPVLTDGPPQAEGAVDRKLLGTTERDDGTTQVTYAGHPLYYYVDDPPGQVLCHDVFEFGGTWLVVEPSGDPV